MTMASEVSVPHLEKDERETSSSPPPSSPTAALPAENEHVVSDTNTNNDAPISDSPQCLSFVAGTAQEYLVKSVQWLDFTSGRIKDVRIITQNENGPCPLVAICNVLLLRGDLEINPPDREVVTFEYLVERLGDYLLNHGPTQESKKPSTEGNPPAEQQQWEKEEEERDATAAHMLRADSNQSSTAEYVLTYRYNLDAALSILPNLQTGLDINLRFSSIRGFEPTSELAMFDLFGVDIVHGWVVDPQDQESHRVVVEKCGSYNSVVECVVRGDTLSSSKKQWTAEEEQYIHEGLVATSFLDDTATQLTYYGLQLLADTIPANKLFVLFRNNHFSTLFKHPHTGGLFILVTDQGLVNQRSIVWESLGDVDQGSSEFFNGEFSKPKVTQGIPDIPPEKSTDLDYAMALLLQRQDILPANESQRLQPPQQQHLQQQMNPQQHGLYQHRPTEGKAAAASKHKSCTIS